jgi:hypothetical protein
MWRVLPVAFIAFVACAAPPKGMRPQTAGQPLHCFQRCSDPGRAGVRSCETICEPQLTAIRWVPDCETRCARFLGEQHASCISACERPAFVCGNARRQDRGPVFTAAVLTLAVIGFSATAALAVQQATDR